MQLNHDLVVSVGQGYAPYAPLPPRPDVVTRWPKEPQARAALEAMLAPYRFTLIPEVRLLERGKPFQFIDYVMLCPPEWPVKAIGIEVKKGFDKLIDGLDAVDQALRYRRARIVDDRVSAVLGDQLSHVFIWPGLHWRDDCQHEAGARAVRVHAGRANVGSIEVRYVYRYDDATRRTASWHPRVRFVLGQEAFWTSYGFELVNGYFGAGSKHLDPTRGLRRVE